MSNAEERLRLLESAVEQSTDAIMLCTADARDPNGSAIVYVNPAFIEMSGYAADELLGQPTSMLESPGVSPEKAQQMQLELASGHTLSGESLVYAKDRSQFMMAWKVQPLRNDDDQVTHIVAIQRDAYGLASGPAPSMASQLPRRAQRGDVFFAVHDNAELFRPAAGRWGKPHPTVDPGSSCCLEGLAPSWQPTAQAPRLRSQPPAPAITGDGT